jgi:hypothetical protein
MKYKINFGVSKPSQDGWEEEDTAADDNATPTPAAAKSLVGPTATTPSTGLLRRRGREVGRVLEEEDAVMVPPTTPPTPRPTTR